MENRKGKLEKELEDPFYLKDPELVKIFEKCKPPKEAYLYFPKGEEIIVMNEKNPRASYRKIYYNVPYFDYEKEEINNLKELINKSPDVKLPDFFDDELLLRFLYADDCEMDKVFKRLKKYIDWSNKTFPLTIQPRSKTIEILNKGFVYVYGRDCKFRPLLIFRLVEFVKYENIYSVEEVLNAGIFLGQFCINNLLAPGHVERWDLIIDLRKTTLLGLPDHIKKLLPIMNEGFISRLNKTYVIGMNFFFRIIYKIVCAFLQESTVKKIKILDGKKDQSMFEEIRRDNVEVDMGGTAPNARIGEENGIFPPRMPSEHFLLESQNADDILISEEEYINKYKNGEIPKDLASPYILNKLEEMKKQESIIENNNINDQSNEQIIQKNKTIEIDRNKIAHSINEQNNNNTFQGNIINKRTISFIQKQKAINERQQKLHKMKTFLNARWEIKEENIHEKYKFISTSKNKLNNVIKDINSLSNKKKNFINNISKISNTKNINYIGNHYNNQ